MARRPQPAAQRPQKQWAKLTKRMLLKSGAAMERKAAALTGEIRSLSVDFAKRFTEIRMYLNNLIRAVLIRNSWRGSLVRQLFSAPPPSVYNRSSR